MSIIYILAIFLLSTTILRVTYLRAKRNKIKPYGQLVRIEGGTMHVFSMGHGEIKIVLLPGLGIPLPSADFSPLMRELSKAHTAICVEYFGMGFSSGNPKSRTCEDYVDEIRAALGQAGFSPPYVLMPHSHASVYSEYYAARYPHEVESIVCLDGSSTAYYEQTPKIIEYVLPIAALMQTLGIIPLAAFLTTNRRKLRSSGYTHNEINDAIVLSGFSLNKTVLKQMVESSEHIKQVMDHPFPASVPYLKIIAQATWETPVKALKMTPQDYQHQHLARVGTHARYEILPGNHFLHANQPEAIAELTTHFLSTLMQ